MIDASRRGVGAALNVRADFSVSRIDDTMRKAAI
jgi:hypothetical protein